MAKANLTHINRRNGMTKITTLVALAVAVSLAAGSALYAQGTQSPGTEPTSPSMSRPDSPMMGGDMHGMMDMMRQMSQMMESCNKMMQAMNDQSRSGQSPPPANPAPQDQQAR
jgi:hypothetical protein